MSYLCEKFNLFNQFVEEVDGEVRLFFISKNAYTSRNFGLFVTSSGKVYGYGDNCYGQLGLGHNKEVNDFTEIPSLKGQIICEFIEGKCCMFARTVGMGVYSWGGNLWGQLGRKCTNGVDDYLKPELIRFEPERDTEIVQMS